MNERRIAIASGVTGSQGRVILRGLPCEVSRTARLK